MAGTLVVANTNPGIQVYTLAWTSTSGGDVSAHAFPIVGGRFVQVQFVPGASSAQPSDLYDVTLTDAAGIDLLSGAGANLSNATPSYLLANPPVTLASQGPFDLVVANAGSVKSGTVTIWIEPLE